jgi:hypothetical protein
VLGNRSQYSRTIWEIFSLDFTKLLQLSTYQNFKGQEALARKVLAVMKHPHMEHRSSVALNFRHLLDRQISSLLALSVSDKTSLSPLMIPLATSKPEETRPRAIDPTDGRSGTAGGGGAFGNGLRFTKTIRALTLKLMPVGSAQRLFRPTRA